MGGWAERTSQSTVCNINKTPRNKIQLEKCVPRTKCSTTDLITYIVTLLVMP